MRFLLRWLATAIATAVAIWLVPGIYAVGDNSLLALVAFALFLSLINAIIKPAAKTLSLPLAIITLGIFYLVINALFLNLASWLSLNVFSSGVMVDDFGSAFVGAIIISILSAIINAVTGANKDDSKKD